MKFVLTLKAIRSNKIRKHAHYSIYAFWEFLQLTLTLGYLKTKKVSCSQEKKLVESKNALNWKRGVCKIENDEFVYFVQHILGIITSAYRAYIKSDRNSFVLAPYPLSPLLISALFLAKIELSSLLYWH